MAGLMEVLLPTWFVVCVPKKRSKTGNTEITGLNFFFFATLFFDQEFEISMKMGNEANPSKDEKKDSGFASRQRATSESARVEEKPMSSGVKISDFAHQPNQAAYPAPQRVKTTVTQREHPRSPDPGTPTYSSFHLASITLLPSFHGQYSAAESCAYLLHGRCFSCVVDLRPRRCRAESAARLPLVSACTLIWPSAFAGETGESP